MSATVPNAVAAAPRVRPSAYPTPYGAVVPAGVGVPVALVTQINSATFNVGDSFAFKTVKDTKLGDVDVPAGTMGHGRVASIDRAVPKHDGSVGLQADSIDLADGTPVWVNIDPATRIQGHLADRHSRFLLVAISTDFSGNMILEPGTPFSVVTIARRAAPAPLMTASPDPATTTAPVAASSPAPKPVSSN